MVHWMHGTRWTRWALLWAALRALLWEALRALFVGGSAPHFLGSRSVLTWPKARKSSLTSAALACNVREGEGR